MRHVSYIVAAAALAGALAGCADPYYPRYGYSQANYYPSGYSYYSAPSYSYYPPPTYSYYSPSYSYPASYNYRSTAWGSDYDRGYNYRNYNGIHPGSERAFP